MRNKKELKSSKTKIRIPQIWRNAFILSWKRTKNLSNRDLNRVAALLKMGKADFKDQRLKCWFWGLSEDV